jgi:hypothetical protein
VGAGNNGENQQINGLPGIIIVNVKEPVHDEPGKIGNGNKQDAQTDKGQIPAGVVYPFSFTEQGGRRT